MIPNMLRQAAQGDVARIILDSYHSYMLEDRLPDSIVPNTCAHDYKSKLNRMAAAIFLSCCAVFAYLTFDTSSQAQASLLMQMIANVRHCNL